MSRSLKKAAVNGDFHEALKLLDGGVEVDTRDKYDSTPLHGAAWNGRRRTVALLLDRGADVDARDRYGFTPFYYAITKQRAKTEKLLREHGGAERVLEKSLRRIQGRSYSKPIA